MKRVLPAVLAAAVLAGCVAPVPFKSAAMAGAVTETPQAVAERFRQDLPEEFHLLSSIIFDYGFIAVSGIGYLDISTVTGRYKAACMNHLGVKFFSFEGDRSGLSDNYVIEPLARHGGDIVGVVSEDIKRIFLDLTPGSNASSITKKHAVVFRQKQGDGALEYEFSGEGMHLASKTYREDNRAVWRVSYYEYERKDGKLYPRGIILSNYRYGYRLIVRQKEIVK